MSILRASAMVLLISMIGVAGCSKSANVTGKVTYKGKPVTSGSVSFIASDSVQYSGQIQPDGTYAIPKVPTGSVKVLVSSPNPGGANRGSTKGRPRGGEGDLAGAPPAAPEAAATTGWFPLPEEYADLAKSKLTLEVKGNPAVLDIELK
jgi:hypothetical protein